jgi:hypothetical protein
MSILLLVVVLLVIAIVLSRLTWASQIGERRSIKHHEQAMDVLRSVSGRPEDGEKGDQGAYAAAHVKSTAEDGASFPAPAARTAVPETSVQREETIRILRSGRSHEAPVEPSSSGPPGVPPPMPRVEPPPTAPWLPPAPTAPAPSVSRPAEELVGSEATGEVAAVEASQTGVESPPSWEPAHVPHSRPDGAGESVKPEFVFLDDDTGRPGPVTLPPDVATAIRGRDGGLWGNGGGDGDDHGDGDGAAVAGWGNGHRWEDDPVAGSSVLPKPPSIGDQAWAGSSRSEARSRSRARTRSWFWGRLLAPFLATGRAASGARDRLGARRSGDDAGAGMGTPDGAAHEGVAGMTDGATHDTADHGSGTLLTAPVSEPPTAESVKVVSDETAEVATPPASEPYLAPVADVPTGAEVPPGADVPRSGGDHGVGPITSPVPEAAAAPWGARRTPSQWAAEVSRRPRFGLAVGLVVIVVVACVVVGVLVATVSTSSNKTQPARSASPPPTTAPAAPPSPLTQLARDDQGAWYNVNTSRLSVSAVATGRVWLEVVAGSNAFGPVLFQGILTNGQTQTITNNAPIWMRIGASSNVNVTVNGTSVVLPQAPNTFNLAFTH